MKRAPKPKPGPQAALEARVFVSLMRTADALARGAEALLKPFNLSGTQYNILRILRGAGEKGLACREVGCRLISRDPDITRLLDRMESRGLIARAREAQDRRVVKTRIIGRAAAPGRIRQAHARIASPPVAPLFRKTAPAILGLARTRPRALGGRAISPLIFFEAKTIHRNQMQIRRNKNEHSNHRSTARHPGSKVAD